MDSVNSSFYFLFPFSVLQYWGLNSGPPLTKHTPYHTTEPLFTFWTFVFEMSGIGVHSSLQMISLPLCSISFLEFTKGFWALHKAAHCKLAQTASPLLRVTLVSSFLPCHCFDFHSCLLCSRLLLNYLWGLQWWGFNSHFVIGFFSSVSGLLFILASSFITSDLSFAGLIFSLAS